MVFPILYHFPFKTKNVLSLPPPFLLIDVKMAISAKTTGLPVKIFLKKYTLKLYIFFVEYKVMLQIVTVDIMLVRTERRFF